MAVLENGLFGPIRNSIGGVTFYQLNGQTVARQKVTPTNPKTEDQTENRNVWRDVQKKGSQILQTIIQKYWNPFSGNISGWSDWIGNNRLAQGTSFSTDNIIVTKGNLEAAQVTLGTYDAGELSVDWNTATLGNGLATDYTIVTVFDDDNNIAFVDDTQQPRSNGNIVMNIGAGRTPASLKAFVSFYRGSGSEMIVSNSSFFQIVAV